MTGLRTLLPILFLLAAAVVLALVFLAEPEITVLDTPAPPGPEAVDRTSHHRPLDREPSVVPLAPASLAGTVRAEPNPVGAGAWIAISAPGKELRVPLEDDGRFLFREVPAGVTLTVWVGPSSEGANLICLTTDLVLKPGEEREIEYSVRLGSVIRGRVVTAEGEAVADAKVAVLPPVADWRDSAVCVATTTDDEGRFYVGVKDFQVTGQLRLIVDAVGRGYILEELLIRPDEMEMGSELTVTLTMGLVIAGRAVTADGAPIVGAAVHILEQFDGDPLVRRPVEGRVKTDENGRFTDNAYRPGIYRLFLLGSATGAPVALVRDGVRAGDENVELRTEAPGTLEIGFIDEVTGEPVAPAEATVELIWGHTGEEERFVPWRDLKGKASARLTGLPPGHYRVGAHHADYEPLFSELLPLEAGDDAKLIFRLKPR